MYDPNMARRAALAAGIALVAWGCGPSEPAPASAARPRNELAVMNVVVVDSLDADPAVNKLQGGGSQGGTGYFRTITAAKIDECTEQVRRGFLAWMQTKKLVALQSIDFPGDVLICASNETLEGVFELKYVIDRPKHYAEASVWYYRKDDTRVEPSEMGSFITPEDIETLHRNIENAIKCTRSP